MTTRRQLLKSLGLGGASLFTLPLAAGAKGKPQPAPEPTPQFLRATLVSGAFTVPVNQPRFTVPYNIIERVVGSDITFAGGVITVPDGIHLLSAGVAFQAEGNPRDRSINISKVGSDIRFPEVSLTDHDAVGTEATDSSLAVSVPVVGPGSYFVWVSVNYDPQTPATEYIAPIYQTFFSAAKVG